MSRYRHTNRLVTEKSGKVLCLSNNNLPCDDQPNSEDEQLLRRILCHLMAELDNQDQTHLKIHVSLAMPMTLRALASANANTSRQSGGITFWVDDHRHTLCVTNLAGTDSPKPNDWLATLYRGPAQCDLALVSVSLGWSASLCSGAGRRASG
jgi:hypothetical protein